MLNVRISTANQAFVVLISDQLINVMKFFQIFKCLICNEKCTSEESFLNHINTLHEGRDREYVVCGDCGAQFRQKNQLKLVLCLII